MITERMKPTSGKVEVGSSVVIGYYDQESRDLNENQRVIDYIRDVAEYLPAADGKSTISASQMLERFLFPPEIQYAIIGNLSGGERRRLYLLRLLMGNPNVLLLDEPTNDLDIPTLVALEAFLDDFEGTLIVVSHDRYFLDRTIDHIFRFEGDGRIREYPGDYSAFLEIKEREEKEAEAKSSSQKKETSVNKESQAKKKKLSFKEQKEYESLEKEIAQLAKRKAELEADLVNHGSDFTKLQAATSEIESITKTLEQKENRWVELAELM
jgi:ATP-binding cassette subfamily F protein uup